MKSPVLCIVTIVDTVDEESPVVAGALKIVLIRAQRRVGTITRAGQLQIKQVWGKGARKTWSDGRTPLEEMLNDVIAGLIVFAEAKRLERLELQRQHEALVEAQRQRAKEEERWRAAAERLKALEQEAAAWTKSQEIAADAVERGALKRGLPVGGGSRTHAWLAWVRAHAARLDPVGRIVAALDAR